MEVVLPKARGFKQRFNFKGKFGARYLKQPVNIVHGYKGFQTSKMVMYLRNLSAVYSITHKFKDNPQIIPKV